MTYKKGDIVKCQNEICKVIHTTHNNHHILVCFITTPPVCAPEWKPVRRLAMTVDVHTYNTILKPYEECLALWVTSQDLISLDPNVLKPYTLQQLVEQLEDEIRTI